MLKGGVCGLYDCFVVVVVVVIIICCGFAGQLATRILDLHGVPALHATK